MIIVSNYALVEKKDMAGVFC